MKKDLAMLAAIVAIVTFCWISTPALAAEEVMTFKPTSVVVKQDKFNQDYVRMVIPATGSKDGIPFSSTYAVMAFGEHVAAAKQIKPGQEVTAVVQKHDYKGQTSYTIIGLKGASQAKKQ